MRKRKARRSDVPERARRLLDVPNVGPAVALDLVRLGISTPEALAGRDPDEMYAALCRLDGVRHDPCVHDVFAAAVSFADGKPARPWRAFSAERKAREAGNTRRPSVLGTRQIE
jgi:Pathogenicity locus